MKLFNKISAILCTAALALGVVSCTTANLDTNQYSDTAVTLASYGPNPVMRGAALRFFGSNLQNVVEVVVPGIDPITDIEVVEKGKVSEIRVILPVEGPEVGYVTLRTKNGEILKTRAELTYTEPIVFDGFEVRTPALPGYVITLKGDYMHLVDHVVFPGGTEVKVEEGATRHEAQVVVPNDAITGKIILSDGGSVENLFYSSEDLVMGKPGLYKPESVFNVKADDVITIKGVHMEMIKYFTFAQGDDTLVAEDFEVAEDGNSVQLVIPASATDGIFEAVSYQGDAFEAGEVKFVLPTELSAAPQPVKAGKELTITGNDLDVVSKVSFDGANDVLYSFTEEGTIVVKVPATAKEGDVTLELPNGYKSTVAFTLVHPTITNVAPLELYAGDEPVVVTGTDLNLVVKAMIGTKECPIAEQSETSVTLATDVTSVGGVVTLTLANGEELVSEETVVMKYHSKVIVTSRPAGQHIGELVVIKGQNMDLIENIYVGTEKVTKYSIRTPEEVQFLMPWLKVGSYDLKFVLFDGDEEVQPDPIEVMLERNINTIWEGEAVVAGWSGSLGALSWGGYDWSTVEVGTTLMIHYRINPAKEYDAVMRAGNGSWAGLPSWKQLPGSDGDGNVPISEDGVLAINLTQADLDELVNNGGLVVCGAWFIVEKVQLINEIPQERTIWSGEAVVAGWSGSCGALSWGGYDWSQVTVGTELIIHYVINPAKEYDAVMRAGNGSWAGLPSWKQLPGSDGDGNVPISEDGELSITLTQADLDELVNNGGLVVCGAWFIVTSIGLL